MRIYCSVSVSAWIVVLLTGVNALDHGRVWQRQSPFLISNKATEFDEWVNKQIQHTLDGILANIGPDGANVAYGNVNPGVVVASPSKDAPNYYYHWVRDGAITMGSLVQEYSETGNETIKKILDAYVDNARSTQITANPSGTFEHLSGLGEPKFETDGRPFQGDWGRPQRDGPALRAVCLISYAKVLMEKEKSSMESLKYLYKVIKPDLEYVSNSWAIPGYDLWEEVQGLHFFTAMAQYQALILGVDFSTDMNDPGAAAWYHTQANGLERFLLAFWDDERGHLVSTLGSPRSGLDAAILLASIHSNGLYPYPMHNDAVIASLQALVADMRGRYPINDEDSTLSDTEPAAVAIGRYPEDVYNGGDGRSGDLGNPWFLCTASVAHVLYGLVEHLALSPGSLVISNLTAEFYLPFIVSSPELKASYYDFSTTAVSTRSETILAFEPSSNETQNIIESVMEYADGFLKVVRRHSDVQGEFSEQFDRTTGFMRGARQLTWSYEAVRGAVKMRGRAQDAIRRRAIYMGEVASLQQRAKL
ncbi:Six-hairpin glycosidase-like protein [Lipomyces arxii]|uniref:Six-hairpin glycosidase-like protein n=1 Tax=Lipomyces arxii TaxID=56418 RepID=UPI0034CEA3C0